MVFKEQLWKKFANSSTLAEAQGRDCLYPVLFKAIAKMLLEIKHVMCGLEIDFIGSNEDNRPSLSAVG